MAKICRASSTAKNHLIWDFEFVDFDFQVSKHLPSLRSQYPNQFFSTFQPPKCPWWPICFSRYRKVVVLNLTL
ncbi:hypothetical protein F383_34483 [Gossypium arboreum]|uniref:Uncharacterized protein n=1 Tax=Gossypium arboreum TaxID=29729 RepID=A0A0B0MZ81_GOSAR|nr:hypothetical protein F383_34483 [Gossypium arboreum]